MIIEQFLTTALTDVNAELIETTLTYIGQSCNIVTEPEAVEYIPNIRFQNPKLCRLASWC